MQQAEKFQAPGNESTAAVRTDQRVGESLVELSQTLYYTSFGGCHKTGKGLRTKLLLRRRSILKKIVLTKYPVGFTRV